MKNNPYSALLLIPITLAINLFLFCTCAFIDTQLIPWNASDGGHPVPVVTLLAFIVMPIIDIVVGIIAIVITLVRVIQARKRKKEENN